MSSITIAPFVLTTSSGESCDAQVVILAAKQQNIESVVNANSEFNSDFNSDFLITV